MKKKITSRIDLNIGMKCNIKCSFCYYLDKVNEPFRDFDELVKTLKLYRKQGIDKIHITGGEPTLYKDLFRLTQTAIKLGFVSVGIITNGIMLKNKSFIIKCQESGIDNFNISIHGHNALAHDELTQAKGSFDMVMKGIENIKELNIPFHVNTVLNRKNYTNLEKLAELFIKLKPQEATILYFNPMNSASDSMNELSVTYSETIPHLNNCINILEAYHIKVFFKFIPLCLISKDYKKNLANLSQALYEDWEWNYEKRYILLVGKKKYFQGLLRNFQTFSKEQINKIPFKTLSYINSILCYESYFYKKLISCKDCRNDMICQGVNNFYLEQYGSNEFKPVYGEKIIHPEFYLYNGKVLKASLCDKILNNILFIFSRIFYKNIN
jgi:MoaA/NifB/PqqE/SkfB family radical SAM enzyme